jgi:pilus assembly protein Flp/PilA
MAMMVIVRFFRDEAGATSIEYALIAVLISLSVIVGATAVGEELNEIFNNVANGF